MAKRENYGIDAPGVVRNLAVAAVVLLSIVTYVHFRGSPEWLAEAFLKTTRGDPLAMLGVLDTFSDVPRGRSLAVMHERGLLSFSINQGDFAGAYHVKRRDTVRVSR